MMHLNIHIVVLFIEMTGILSTDLESVANVNPLNSAVVQYDPVSFRCGSSRSISCKWYHWLYKTSSIDDAKIIFNGNQISLNLPKRFRVDYSENSKSCELHISQTRVWDAGIYECRIFWNNSVNSVKSAHLIVLESMPTCHVVYYNQSKPTAPGEFVHLRCALKFKGNWSPVMSWDRSDGESVNNYSSTIYESSGSMSSALDLKVSPEMTDVIFSCTVRWLLDDRLDLSNCSDNVPVFNFTSTFRVSSFQLLEIPSVTTGPYQTSSYHSHTTSINQTTDKKLPIILSVAGVVFVLCFVWIAAFVTYLTRRTSVINSQVEDGSKMSHRSKSHNSLEGKVSTSGIKPAKQISLDGSVNSVQVQRSHQDSNKKGGLKTKDHYPQSKPRTLNDDRDRRSTLSSTGAAELLHHLQDGDSLIYAYGNDFSRERHGEQATGRIGSSYTKVGQDGTIYSELNPTGRSRLPNQRQHRPIPIDRSALYASIDHNVGIYHHSLETSRPN